jgi:hypothetical protein
MGDVFRYVGEHFLTVTLPLTLGFVILILTFWRWMNKQK